MPETKVALPHWDLSNVYKGLETEDFEAGMATLDGQLADLEGLIEKHGIGRLDEPHREVVILHHVEGLRVREVADLVDRPVGSVKRMLSEAVYWAITPLGAAGGTSSVVPATIAVYSELPRALYALT